MLYFAIATDVFHALLMAAWIVGIPLLFWRGCPRLSVAYCIFSVLFIIVNQVSHYTLGKCVFTTMADWCYNHAGQRVTDEWFVVRMTKLIFGCVPTQRVINIATQIIIGISAVGGMYLFVKRQKEKSNV
jgi:hypothetical protein